VMDIALPIYLVGKNPSLIGPIPTSAGSNEYYISWTITPVARYR
jgi:hypothetical protein